MLRFSQIKHQKKKNFIVQKTIKTWDVDVGIIVASKVNETKNDSKYFIGYLDQGIKSLVLILSKMSGYVKTCNDKDR